MGDGKKGLVFQPPYALLLLLHISCSLTSQRTHLTDDPCENSCRISWDVHTFWARIAHGHSLDSTRDYPTHHTIVTGVVCGD